CVADVLGLLGHFGRLPHPASAQRKLQRRETGSDQGKQRCLQVHTAEKDTVFDPQDEKVTHPGRSLQAQRVSYTPSRKVWFEMLIMPGATRSALRSMARSVVAACVVAVVALHFTRNPWELALWSVGAGA